MRSSLSVFGTHAFRVIRQPNKQGCEWAPRANASSFQVISTTLARYDHHEILKSKDAIHEAYVDLLADTKWIDCVSKSTGDYQNIKYAFETWRARLDQIMKASIGLDKTRLFSMAFKENLYEQNKYCSICGQRISSILDAHVDHVEEYWLGGRTIPENARLTHRTCNMKRPRASASQISST